jgi:hypothetical protein
MVGTLIIAGLVIYAAFHLGAGHAHYRHQRAHGRRGVSVYWNSARRGPWVSVPLPGGFRVGHRL